MAQISEETLQALQDKIGYRFQKTVLIGRALTHASTGAARNYERLEFLGDRVLGLVVAHILWETFPEESEGDLAKRHAALVQGKMLAEVARAIALGDYMILSESERAGGGAENENILADGLESILGAMYLDGGLEVCEDFIRRKWGNSIHTMTEPPQDPKTALQEWAQARGLPLPVYELADREGPDHAPVFRISVTVEGYPPAIASGSSRRKAEKEAAEMLLALLKDSA